MTIHGSYYHKRITAKLVKSIMQEMPASALREAAFIVRISGEFVPKGGDDDTPTLREAWKAALDLLGE
jgi:hypothetical protein